MSCLGNMIKNMFKYSLLVSIFGVLTSMNTIMGQDKYELATFGGGCFWCTEAMYEQLNGVEKVISGYSAGEIKNPTYEQVCSGETGHAEVIQITFNPDKITFLELLEVFFKTHDPTTLNRQGADVGSQYRSIILYHNNFQKNTAKNIIQALVNDEIYENPIVTQVEAFDVFYSAENYHQNYYQSKGSENQYCNLVVTPKLEKFKKLFEDKLKK